MHCSNCGARVDETSAVCANCGAPIHRDASVATPMPPVAPIAPAAPTAPLAPLVPAFDPATVVTASPGPHPVVNVVPQSVASPIGAVPGTLPGPPPGFDAMPRATYAGFWRRFWTMFVDYVVTFPFGLAVRILLGVGLFESDWSRESAMVFAFGMLSGWLYDALMESSKWQGTLGQQLLGLKVTDRLGRRISFGRATARHVAQYLSIFTLGIGYLVMLFNRRRLTLHDWISGCQIVRALEAPVAAPMAPAAPAPGPTLAPYGGGAR